MSWQKAIVLNPNEQVLHSWDGNCERHHKSVEARIKIIGVGGVGHKTVESKETHSGTLVLTNQRLLWFERRGFLSRTERASFEIDLKDLKGITCGGTINMWVSITDTGAENIFHLAGVGKKEIEPFRDMILRQVEKLKAGNTETLNVNIRKEILKGTLPPPIPPTWNCLYCKGVNFQTLTECKHCGAPRKVADQNVLSSENPQESIE
jgi:hypothetical protein